MIAQQPTGTREFSSVISYVPYALANFSFDIWCLLLSLLPSFVVSRAYAGRKEARDQHPHGLRSREIKDGLHQSWQVSTRNVSSERLSVSPVTSMCHGSLGSALGCRKSSKHPARQSSAMAPGRLISVIVGYMSYGLIAWIPKGFFLFLTAVIGWH